MVSSFSEGVAPLSGHNFVSAVYDKEMVVFDVSEKRGKQFCFSYTLNVESVGIKN